jgi:hypothetical protein
MTDDWNDREKNWHRREQQERELEMKWHGLDLIEEQRERERREFRDSLRPSTPRDPFELEQERREKEARSFAKLMDRESERKRMKEGWMIEDGLVELSKKTPR